MLCDKNEAVQNVNFIDGVDFTRNDPCIFVTFPAGAAGDLLISIIDKHYLRTGCEYYGIDNNGKVCLLTTDYDLIDLHKKYEFNDQWFFDLSESLGGRNLNYSLLDQVIFGCHMYKNNHVQYILNVFPNAKIINIKPVDYYGGQLIKFLKKFKLENMSNINVTEIEHDIEIDTVRDSRVYNLPFGALFNERSYDYHYQKIIDFLGLEGRLICYDYVQYYLKKQHPEIRDLLINYSESLCLK